MIFDLWLANGSPHATPAAMRDAAQAADELGFRALWASDHLLPPREQARFARTFEPLTVLAHLAGVTRRIRLGTSVVVLPMRSPFVVAKQAASIDQLSDGRLILGIGVGWSTDEFANVHAEFHTRGARLEESIQLFRHLWSGSGEPFDGRFYAYQDGVFDPLPVQGADLPLMIGGRSDAVLKRVARHAAIWQTTSAGPDVFPSLVEKIRAEPRGERVEVGGTLAFEDGDVDAARARVQTWQAAGAQHLAVNFGDPEGRLARMHRFASAFSL